MAWQSCRRCRGRSKLTRLRKHEKSERERLRQVICVKPLRGSVLVGGVEKKLEKLLCWTILDIDLQIKVPKGSVFQLSIYSFDERYIQHADEELEFGT